MSTTRRCKPPSESLSWQGNLLVVAPSPVVDGSFASVERAELDSRTWVEHCPAWLGGADAVLGSLAATLPWRQREVVMYERLLPEPRLTSWWSAIDGAPEPLAVLAEARSVLGRRYGRAFDSIGFNLYRDGRDSVAWHGDRVRHLVEHPVVAIVSLGEPRPLRLRPRGGGPSRAWSLGGGDLFVMGGACQHDWEHCVPKTARPIGPRLSVMFRHDLGRFAPVPYAREPGER